MGDKIVENVTCPVCGDHVFDDEWVDQKLYICRHKVDDDLTCGHLLAYCKKCEKFYDENGFGQHGDVWECKECGAVCWPLTERERKRQELLKAFNSMKSSFYGMFGNR